MATKTNPFAKFAVGEKKAHIKSLDAEITYRPLTMVEADTFNSRLIKDYDDEGKVSFDYDEATEIKYEKVALCLIEPKMTVEDLKALGGGALEAITEINNLIDGVEEKKEEKKS